VGGRHAVFDISDSPADAMRSRRTLFQEGVRRVNSKVDVRSPIRFDG